jgi:predicted dehydrogenase
MNRREFLAGAAGGAGGPLLLPCARTAGAYSANERMRLAVFGAMYNAEHFLTAGHLYNADIVALCNPDQRKIPGILKRWEETAQKMVAAPNADQRVAERYRRLAKGEGVKIYADVRRMLGEMADQIDAVIVSDYDHFHGVACGGALRAGKPVCSERPLGLTLSDARALRALTARTKVPTTYRSPGTGTGPFRRAMELVQEGAIGPVQEAHVWFKRGGPDREAAPRGRQEVPEGLDWDLWLGPLPWRDYHPDWMAYAHWRETSNGGLGSFGPHTSVFPFLTLGLRELWDRPGARIRVQAECSRLNRVSFPRWERVRWEIPAREDRPPATMTWHHGPDYAPGTRQLMHERLRQFGVSTAQDADALMGNAGSLLLGTEGALVADDHSVRVTFLPRDRFGKVETNRPQHAAASQGIYRDWIDACRGAKPNILANFDNGGRLSELLMLGNIATQFPGETISYDCLTGQILGPAEAGGKLAYQYRDGWRI